MPAPARSAHIAKGRAIHNERFIAGLSNDTANLLLAVAVCLDIHVGPAVGDQSAPANAADQAADIAVLLGLSGTGNVARGIAVIDHTPAARRAALQRRRQNTRVRARFRVGEPVVDLGVRHAKIVDPALIADHAEEARNFQIGRFRRRADRQPGNGVAAAVKNAAKAHGGVAVIMADRRPLRIRNVHIRVQPHIRARIAFARIDGRRKITQLLARLQDIRIILRAGAGGKNGVIRSRARVRAGLRFLCLGLAQRVLDSRLDPIAASRCTGDAVDLIDLFCGTHALKAGKQRLRVLPVTRGFLLADRLDPGDSPVGNRHAQGDVTPITRTGSLIHAVLIDSPHSFRRKKLLHRESRIGIRLLTRIHGIGRERAAEHQQYRQYQRQEPVPSYFLHLFNLL